MIKKEFNVFSMNVEEIKRRGCNLKADVTFKKESGFELKSVISVNIINKADIKKDKTVNVMIKSRDIILAVE